ncbi:hypothetical protein DSECCO2_607970 [anaerobic digester metagenome]
MAESIWAGSMKRAGIAATADSRLQRWPGVSSRLCCVGASRHEKMSQGYPVPGSRAEPADIRMSKSDPSPRRATTVPAHRPAERA